MRHGDSTLHEAHAALDLLGGSQGLSAILASRGDHPEEVKFGSTTLGQIEAFRNKLPEGVWEAAVAGEIEFVVESPDKVSIRRKQQLLVDADGRFIFRNIRQVKPVDWSFGFDRSICDTGYTEALERLEYAFERPIGFSVAQFQDRADTKRAAILRDPLVANLFAGRHARPFAIALPQMQVPREGGLGKLLASTIMPAAKRGYNLQYPERAFNHHRGGTLVGQVSSFQASRQERLIAALAQGPQVLWVFLNCLQGGSFNAARQIIPTLPEEYLLGGTLASVPVIAAYPEIAAASARCPLYFCAADVFQRGDSLYLCPSDAGVGFDSWGALGYSYGRYSASVAVLA